MNTIRSGMATKDAGPLDDEIGKYMDLLGAIIRAAAMHRFTPSNPEWEALTDEEKAETKIKPLIPWQKLKAPRKKQALLAAYRWWQNCEPLTDEDWSLFLDGQTTLKEHGREP